LVDIVRRGCHAVSCNRRGYSQRAGCTATGVKDGGHSLVIVGECARCPQMHHDALEGG